jgi:hypothetical protein
MLILPGVTQLKLIVCSIIQQVYPLLLLCSVTPWPLPHSMIPLRTAIVGTRQYSH